MKIQEMTMRGPNFDNVAQEFVGKNQARWKKYGKHIGDIEDYKVLQDGIYYSVWDNDAIVAVTSLSNASNEVDDVWVSPQYRGKKIFSMLLWFFKTRLQRDKLLLGPIHSASMQEVVKGLSRFNKSWVNIRTNEIKPFSSDTVDEFYSYAGPTQWRLMLENSGDFSSLPKFNVGGFVKESYYPYID
jgi:hypothetical protein